MLLSNRQRKYMSLLLCLLMIFTIFSWNVQQVHANPAVAVAGKYVVGGILAGMGYVATTTEGQEALGQFVYDHVDENTRQRLILIAGAVVMASNQAIKLSTDLFTILNSFMNQYLDDGSFVIPESFSTFEFAYNGEQSSQLDVGQVVNFYVVTNVNDNYGVPINFNVTGTKLNFVKKDFDSMSWRYTYSLSWVKADGLNGYTYAYTYDSSNPSSFSVSYEVPSQSIALNPDFQPKNTVPPPFWLPINDAGTLTLPQTQDALYDGVPLAPDSDLPYSPGETTGTIEGDVGVISGVVGTIGQILSNIWNKILEILSSMVAFFQAIMTWVNAFFSELALTIGAVLTEFFTVPTPFVLPTDMFDGMLDDLLDKTGLSSFDQTFSRLQNLQTGYGSPPEITINLHELMAATSNIGSGFSVPLANKESLVIDFAKLEEVEFWNMSLIDLIRALLSLSMVGMTFNYIYRKIIPDKVIE